ncbi:hypothetical protein KEM60_01147 [Austwickia sp. TVS 96-490-7B]|nr:hypothetical protein [Austwickia sp. TVS 96-490-7B]
MKGMWLLTVDTLTPGTYVSRCLCRTQGAWLPSSEFPRFDEVEEPKCPEVRHLTAKVRCHGSHWALTLNSKHPPVRTFSYQCVSNWNPSAPRYEELHILAQSSGTPP